MLLLCRALPALQFKTVHAIVWRLFCFLHFCWPKIKVIVTVCSSSSCYERDVSGMS